MPAPDDLARLQHIRDAAREAIAIVGDLSVAEFQRDRVRTLAVVRLIEVIGEAASTTSAPTRARFSELPWREMVSMRNRLIHAYFDIDEETVYLTVVQDLSSLVGRIDAAIAALQRDLH